MNYLDADYDEYVDKTYLYEDSRELSSQETSSLIKNVPIYNLENVGSLSTNDKNTTFNLNDNYLIVEDKLRTKVKIGKLGDNDYGIKVWDDDGTLVIDY